MSSLQESELLLEDSAEEDVEETSPRSSEGMGAGEGRRRALAKTPLGRKQRSQHIILLIRIFIPSARAGLCTRYARTGTRLCIRC